MSSGTLTPDMVNSLVELGGAWFTWRNAWQLFKDKSLSGVYWPTNLFFTLFGVWNLYYYTSIAQPYSFYAAILLTMGNATWVAMAINLRFKQRFSLG